jgi:hypothetical protein
MKPVIFGSVRFDISGLRCVRKRKLARGKKKDWEESRKLAINSLVE